MKALVRKLMSFFVVFATLIAQMNLPIAAESTINNETTVADEPSSTTIDNIEEESETIPTETEEITSEPTTEVIEAPQNTEEETRAGPEEVTTERDTVQRTFGIYSVYTITFNANGGTINGGTTDTATVSDGDYLELRDDYWPERAGYHFSGWVPASDMDYIHRGTYYPESSDVLVAKWVQVGVDSISTLFHDPIVAQTVANKISGGNITYIPVQADLNQITSMGEYGFNGASWDTASNLIKNFGGIELLTEITKISVPGIETIFPLIKEIDITNLEKIEDFYILGMEDTLQSIGKVTNLIQIKYLAISLIESTSITNIGEISNLINLETMSIFFSKNEKITSIGKVDNLINCRVMNIDFGRNELISDIGKIDNLTSLGTLTLLFSKNDSISDIGLMDNLVGLINLQLTFQNNTLISNIGNLSNLSTLRLARLLFNNNSQIANLGNFNNCSQLHTLELWFSKENQMNDLGAVTSNSLVSYTLSGTHTNELNINSNSLRHLYIETGSLINEVNVNVQTVGNNLSSVYIGNGNYIDFPSWSKELNDGLGYWDNTLGGFGGSFVITDNTYLSLVNQELTDISSISTTMRDKLHLNISGNQVATLPDFFTNSYFTTANSGGNFSEFSLNKIIIYNSLGDGVNCEEMYGVGSCVGAIAIDYLHSADEGQQLTSSEILYADANATANGMSNPTAYSVPAHNPFNGTSGSEGEYGTYTLDIEGPDANRTVGTKEYYTDFNKTIQINEDDTIGSPTYGTLDVAVEDGATEASYYYDYVYEDVYDNTIRMNGTMTHPLSWIDAKINPTTNIEIADSSTATYSVAQAASDADLKDDTSGVLDNTIVEIDGTAKSFVPSSTEYFEWELADPTDTSELDAIQAHTSGTVATYPLTIRAKYTFDGGSTWYYSLPATVQVEVKAMRTLSYDPNTADSGTVPALPTSYATGGNATVLGNTGTLARAGYTFDGWNTQADGLGTAYIAGNTIVMNNNTTLFAQWRANSQTITWDYNGGVDSGSNTQLVDTTSWKTDDKIMQTDADAVSNDITPPANKVFGGWRVGTVGADFSGTGYTVPNSSVTFVAVYYDGVTTTEGLNANDVAMKVSDYNLLTNIDDLSGVAYANVEVYDLPAHTLASPQPTITVTTTAGTIGSAVAGQYTATYTTVAGTSATKRVVLYDDTDSTSKGLNANDVTMKVSEYNALTSLHDLSGTTYGNAAYYEIPSHTLASPQPTINVTTTAGVIGSAVEGVYTATYQANGLSVTKQLRLTAYDDENATHGLKANNVTMSVAAYNSLLSINDLAGVAYGNPVQYDIPAHTVSGAQPTYTVTTSAAAIGTAVSGTYTLSFSGNTLTANKTLTLYDDTDGTTLGLNANNVTMKVSDYNALANINVLAGSAYADAIQYDVPAHTASGAQPTFTVAVTGATLGSAVAGQYPMTITGGTLTANKTLTLYDDTDGTSKGLNANDVTMKVSEYNALTALHDLSGATYGNAAYYEIPSHTLASPQPTINVTTTAGVIGAAVEGVYTATYQANGLSVTKQLRLTAYDDENATHGLKANNVTMSVADYNSLLSINDLAGVAYGNPVQYDIPAHTVSGAQPTYTVTTSAAAIGTAVSGTYTLSFSGNTLTANKTLTLYDDTDGTTLGLNANNVTMKVSDYNALTNINVLAGSAYADAVQYDVPAHTASGTQPSFTVIVTGATLGSAVAGQYPMAITGGTLTANKTLTLYDDTDGTSKGLNANDVTMKVSDFNSLANTNLLAGTTYADAIQYDVPAHIASTTQPTFTVAVTGTTIGSAVAGQYPMAITGNGLTANKTLTLYDDTDGATLGLNARDIVMKVDDYNSLTAVSDLAGAIYGNPVQYDVPAHTPSSSQPTFNVTTTASAIGTGVVGVYTVTYSANGLTVTKGLRLTDYDDENATHGLKANDVTMKVSDFNLLTNISLLAGVMYGDPVQYDIPAHTISTTQPTYTVSSTALVGSAVAGTYPLIFNGNSLTANKTLVLYDDTDSLTKGLNANNVTMKVSDFNTLLDIDDLAGVTYANAVHYDLPAHTVTGIQPTFTVAVTGATIGSAISGTYPMAITGNGLTANKTLTLYDDTDGTTLGLNANNVTMKVSDYNALTNINVLAGAAYADAIQYDVPAHTASGAQPTFTVIVTGATLGSAVAGQYPMAITGGTLTANKMLTLYDDTDGTSKGLNANDVTMKVSDFNSLANTNLLAGTTYADAIQYDVPAHTASTTQPTFTVAVTGTTLGSAVAGQYPMAITGNGLTANKTLTLYDDTDGTSKGLNARDIVMNVDDYNALTTLTTLATNSYGNAVHYDVPAHTASNPQPTFVVTTTAGAIGSGVVGTYSVTYQANGLSVTKSLRLTDYDDENAAHGLKANNVTMKVSSFNALVNINALAGVTYADATQYDIATHTPSTMQPTFAVNVSGATIGSAVSGTYPMTISGNSLTANKTLTLYDDTDGTSKGLNANNVTMKVSDFNTLLNIDDLAGASYADAIHYDLPTHTPTTIQPTFTVAVTGATIGSAVSGTYPMAIMGNGLTANKTLTLYDDTDGTTLGLNANNVTMSVTAFDNLSHVNQLAGASYADAIQYDVPAHTASATQPTFTVAVTGITIGDGIVGTYPMTINGNGLTVTKTLTLYDDTDGSTKGLNADNVTMRVDDFNLLANTDLLAGNIYANAVQYDVPAHTASAAQPTFTVNVTGATIGSAVAGQYTMVISGNGLTANKTLTLYDDTDSTTLGLNANHVTMKVEEYDALTNISDLAGIIYGNPIQYDVPAHTPSSPQPTFTVTTSAPAIGSGLVGTYTATYSANGLTTTKFLILTDYDDEDATYGIKANHVTMKVSDFNSLTTVDLLAGATYGNAVRYDIPAHTPSTTQPTFSVVTTAVHGSAVAGSYPLNFNANGLTAHKTLTLYDDTDYTTLGLNANDVVMRVSDFNSLTNIDDLTSWALGNPVQYDLPAHTISSPQPIFTATSTAVVGSASAGSYPLAFTGNGLVANKTLTLYDDTDATTKGLNADDVVMSVSNFNTLVSINDLAVYANAVHYDIPTHTPTSPQPTFVVNVTSVSIGNGLVGTYPMTVEVNGLTANKTLTLYDDTDTTTKGLNADHVTMKVSSFDALTHIDDLAVHANAVHYDIPTHIATFPQPTFSVTVTGAAIGSGVAGVYPMTVEANSLIATKTLTLIEAPTIDPVHPGINSDITGNGEPGYTITVTLPDGSTVTTIVDGNGEWSITSPIELFPGETILADQTSPDGVTSDVASTIVTPYPPTIDPIHPGENADVCGVGEPGYIVTVTFPDGSVSTVTVAADGTWCVVSPIELFPGDEVEAEQTDPSGNTSEKENGIVTPYPPTIDPINPGVDVCGQGEPGYIVTVTFPDGSQATVTVAVDGTWCVVSPIPLEPGDEVDAEQTDPSGNTSEKETETVTPYPPTIDPINPGENPDVCGQGEPGYDVTVTFPDGSQATVTVAADGTWCVVSPIELFPGDEVDAEQTDPDGNTSEKETETVTPYPPTIDPIKPGETPDVCGQGEPGYIVTVTFPDGSQATVTVAADGTWCVVSPIDLEEGDEVEAEQTDPDGNTSLPDKEIVGAIEYGITGNNFSLDINEFNKIKANGTLNDVILEQSNARAFITHTDAEVGPISVDPTNLTSAEVTIGEAYKVELTYSISTSSGRALSESEMAIQTNGTETGTSGTISTEIEVLITGENALLPGLPITGENVRDIMIIGLIGFIVSLTYFAFVLYKKRKQNI